MNLLIVAFPLLLLAVPLSAADGWWFLAREYDHKQRSTPRAIGPFPTRELCRIAGHDKIPDAHEFWTPQIMAERMRWQELANQHLQTAAAALKGKGGWIDSSPYGCGQRQIGKDGKETGIFSGCATIGPLPTTAIAGCVETISPEVLK